MPIPHVIHQFWDRPDPPDDVKERMASWPARHPGWRHVIWSDESAAGFLAESFGADAVRCFLAAKLPEMRSDIFRLAALAADGGLYVDADFGCRESVEPLLSGEGLVSYGKGRKTGKVKVSNNFLASEAGGMLVSVALERALHNVRRGGLSLHVSQLTGPILLTSVWRKRLTEADRARYRLIDDVERARFIKRSGRLHYRSQGRHWVQEIRKRRIIDFAMADERLAGRGGQSDR